MVRDLSLLSAQPEKLEKEVFNNPENLNPSLFRDIPVINEPGKELAIGDVVLFRLGPERGAYPDMETAWGSRVALVPGRNYLGVLCERLSSKLINAEFDKPPRLGKDLDLQFIAQAGGIGWATGFSPALERENGTGIPADVKILGVIGHHQNPEVSLNIIEHTKLYGNETIERRIPHVLCVGTATDVGKTTVMGALLGAFSSRFVCNAVKASGTGWYEDSQIHVDGGAQLGLSYTAVGLPTTYNLPEALYLSRISRVLDMASSIEKIPAHLLPPELRGKSLKSPDMVFIEHGGDLIEANIPPYLENKELMNDVRAIVICSESAVSFRGALSELTERIGNVKPRIIANMPLVNPQGFMRRIDSLLDSGAVAGVVDVNKPDLPIGRKRRLCYANSYERILTPQTLITLIQ
jgi:hypothetical protein